MAAPYVDLATVHEPGRHWQVHKADLPVIARCFGLTSATSISA
jgi:hypothetical protein